MIKLGFLVLLLGISYDTPYLHNFDSLVDSVRIKQLSYNFVSHIIILEENTVYNGLNNVIGC